MNIFNDITLIIVCYNSYKLIQKNLSEISKFKTIIVDNSKSDEIRLLVEGIKNIGLDDINFAKELDLKIKLLAISEKLGNKIKQRVHPCLIPAKMDISNINGVTNAIVVDGKPIGRTIYEGEGAGKGPTSSAVISDISSIMVGKRCFIKTNYCVRKK